MRMVTFAQANKGRSLEDFAEKASSLSWIKSMSDTEAQCMIAFGCVVLAKLSGIKRLDVWDFLFGWIVSDKDARDILLNTYYSHNSPKPELDGVVAGFYHYLHDTHMVVAIRDTYRRTRSQDAAYMAGVCASGGELYDEGNLHLFEGSEYVVDFDLLSTGGSLKRRNVELFVTEEDVMRRRNVLSRTKCSSK